MKIPLRKVSNVLIIITTLLLISSLISCDNMNRTEINLSANEVQKEIVFDQILNDPQLMNEFMEEMMQDRESMYYMIENESFMHYMLTGENLEYMMEHNHRFGDETMHYMMDHFNSDSSMQRNEMIHDAGE